MTHFSEKKYGKHFHGGTTFWELFLFPESAGPGARGSPPEAGPGNQGTWNTRPKVTAGSEAEELPTSAAEARSVGSARVETAAAARGAV